MTVSFGGDYICDRIGKNTEDLDLCLKSVISDQDRNIVKGIVKTW